MILNLEEWRYLAEPFYDVFPRIPADEASVDAEAFEGGGVLITKLTAPPQILIHDPKTRKSASHEFLLFESFFRDAAKRKWAMRPLRSIRRGSISSTCPVIMCRSKP